MLYLAPRIGFPWAIRVIGFITAAMCVVACCTLQKRLPHNKKAGSSIDLKAVVTDRNYGLTVIAVWLVEFAVFIPYTYISSCAIHMGMEPQHAYLLNALLNAGAIPGRALPGYIADRYGPFNVMCGTSLTCATFVLVLWQLASNDEAAVTAFSVIYGFWSGAAISLTPVCVGRVCKTEDYGKRSGTAFSIASFGPLFGIPIAGAILGAENGVRGLIIFAGVMYLVATLAFVLARAVAGGFSWRVVF